MNLQKNSLEAGFHSFGLALSVGLLQISSLSAQSAWTQLSPQPPIPPPRDEQSTVYNPTSNRLIVFGGAAGPGGSYTNDVWVMTNANGVGTPSWTQLFASGAPGSPPPRIQHTAVYDVANNRMIIFGGFSFGLAEFSDVWVLANADGTGGTPVWTQLAPSGSTPARTNHGAIYDAASNRMVVFLGDTTGYLFPGFKNTATDVWALTNANGLGGTPAWIQLAPSGTPPPGRWVNPIDTAYDPASNRLVIYGGVAGKPNDRFTYGDSWVLTNANGLTGTPAWQQLNPTGSLPVARVGAYSFYDSLTNRLVVFGGTFDPGDFPSLTDTWVLSNANGIGTPFWQQVSPQGTAVSARRFGQGVYDKLRNLMIIHGGQLTPGPSFAVTSETWVLSNATGLGINQQLRIDAITPNHGGNIGSVTVRITGAGFQSGAVIKLTGVGQDILGTNTQWIDTGLVTSTFALAGIVPGTRTIVITNPDNTSTSLPAGFTIDNGGGSNVEVSIIGRNAIRFGNAQTYYVQVQNTGNVDSPPGLVSLNVPAAIIGQQMNGSDLFIAGSTTNSEFGIQMTTTATSNGVRALSSTANSGNDQILLLATSTVPSGGNQTAPFLLTLPVGSALPTFTVKVAWQPSVADLPFDQYLASIGDPYIAFQAACSQCYAQAVTQVNALTDADTAYTAWQTSMQDLSSEQDNLCVSVASVLAQGAVVTALGLSAPEGLALSAVIASGTFFVNHFLDPTSDSDANLNSLVNSIGRAAIDFRADPLLRANPIVVKLLTVFDAFIAGVQGAGSIDQASGAEQAAWGTFQQKLSQYLVARTAYQSCLSQSCGTMPLPPSPLPPPGTSSLMITGVSSLDPNDKLGPVGAGPQQFVNGSNPLNYLIDFENQASATAPVQSLTVVDQLTLSSFQLSTAALGPIMLNGNQLTPPSGSQAYTGQIDLRPAQSLLVNVAGNINTISGVVNWQMAAIDPVTGLPPTDPLAGFLAPGQSGSVSLRVAPNAGLITGATITNQAVITFDVNPPIPTPIWTNSIDSTPPTTRVQALSATQTLSQYAVSWSGMDLGSGVAAYSIYRSVDGGPFQLWLANTTAMSATDTGQPGHTYAYSSQGIDKVGNAEILRLSADTSTTIQGSACAEDVTSSIVVQRGGFRLNNATGQFVQTITLTNAGSTPIAGPVSLVLIGLSSNAVLFNKTGSTSCSSPAGSPFIDMGIATPLAAGNSVTTTLQFTDPTKTGITYNTRVLAGTNR